MPNTVSPTMHAAVSWQVELAVKPGEFDNFRALTSEMVAATKREPGVLVYERHVSADRTAVYVYERYADSAAAVTHLLAFARTFGERFARMVERRRFLVFGAASGELRAILVPLGATFFERLDGFSASPTPLS